MFVNTQHKKGNDYLDEQKYDKALIAFNKALEKSPDHPDILSHRGVAYLHLNQKKNCLDDLLHALKLEPENSYRYASLAYARDFFGDLDGAIADYEKAVKIDPKDAIAHNNLGLLQEKKGYQQKARNNFERADKLAEIENKFMKTLDEQEQNVSQSEDMKPKPSSGEKLQPKKLQPDKKEKSMDVVKSVFTKKSAFIEFLAFIKNGFKLKKHD